jgi:diguanylate cyclase (GGDEF)-like protein
VIEPALRTVLIRPEQTERVVYLLLKGTLEVHLEAELSTPVAQIVAGQSVGELSVIDQRPASAYVVTAEPSRLLAVDDETFWRLVRVSHSFAVNLLNLLAQRMRANNEQLSASVQRGRLLEREAVTDALTGLYNRRWLDQLLPRLVARHQRSERPFSVMMLDIDHFKRVNDELGHAAGDQVLAGVAKALNAQVRPTDLAARYGGEEMVVALPDTPLEGARIAAERLRQRIESSRFPGIERAITVSIGVAALGPQEAATELLGRADELLYRAKSRGRNRVES